MKVVPLALHSPRVIENALRSRGWDAGRAADAAGGIHPAAFLLTELDSGRSRHWRDTVGTSGSA